MPLLHALNPLYVLSGFTVGFLVPMTAMGGGSLMTSLLILLFHMHPTTAVGTDLLYASVTKTGGSPVHGLHKTIDWRIVQRLALRPILAATLTFSGLRLLG
jgi:uncharacterized membrane protein YfcA